MYKIFLLHCPLKMKQSKNAAKSVSLKSLGLYLKYSVNTDKKTKYSLFTYKQKLLFFRLGKVEKLNGMHMALRL